MLSETERYEQYHRLNDISDERKQCSDVYRRFVEMEENNNLRYKYLMDINNLLINKYPADEQFRNLLLENEELLYKNRKCQMALFATCQDAIKKKVDELEIEEIEIRIQIRNEDEEM